MTKSPKKTFLVGVDVGGSKIMAGLFTPRLRLVKSVKFSTHVHRGGDDVVKRIVGGIHGLLESQRSDLSHVAAIGVGTPGIIDAQTGTVIAAPLLHWSRFALKSRLMRALKRPLVVHNDCSVAMAAIYDLELERKPRSALGLFFGTGVGGALVLNGSLYTGAKGIAGEIGHVVVDRQGPECGCGSRGCLEVFASRSGIADRLRAAVERGESTTLDTLLEADRREPGTLRTEHLQKAMRQGDKLTRRIVHEAALYAGIAVSNLINLLSPDVVVLGGGLIDHLKDVIMPVVHHQVNEHALVRFLGNPEVFATRLGDKAGITGAAVLARNGGAI